MIDWPLVSVEADPAAVNKWSFAQSLLWPKLQASLSTPACSDPDLACGASSRSGRQCWHERGSQPLRANTPQAAMGLANSACDLSHSKAGLSASDISSQPISP